MPSEMRIVLAGVGGQGTVLAGNILALSAIQAGLSVRTYGDMGMARRGGSVSAFVNISRKPGSSSTAEGTADVLLGIEPIEAVRYCRYLRKDGIAIINTHIIPPSTLTRKDRAAMPVLGDLHAFIKKNFKNTIAIDAFSLAKKTGPVTMNMVMLGAAFATGLMPIPTETFKHTVRDSFSPESAKKNLEAFERGYKEYKRMMKGGG